MREENQSSIGNLKGEKLKNKENRLIIGTEKQGKIRVLGSLKVIALNGMKKIKRASKYNCKWRPNSITWNRGDEGTLELQRQTRRPVYYVTITQVCEP